jgi:hypothetical protein
MAPIPNPPEGAAPARRYAQYEPKGPAPYRVIGPTAPERRPDRVAKRAKVERYARAATDDAPVRARVRHVITPQR